jgi:hypothetical protein
MRVFLLPSTSLFSSALAQTTIQTTVQTAKPTPPARSAPAATVLLTALR